MPRNAIATAAVDLVLPVAKIPEALAEYDRHMTPTFTRNGLHKQNTARNWLPENRTSAHENRLRFQAVQVGNPAASDRTTHGNGSDRD
jgi:hypothetical protein